MQRLGNILRDLVREGIAAYAHVAEKRMHGDASSLLSVFLLGAAPSASFGWGNGIFLP